MSSLSKSLVAASSLIVVHSFQVALDNRAIQALQRKFTVLTLPKSACIGSGLKADGDPAAWRPDCAPGLTRYLECDYYGFQYSMEWYFATMLRDNVQYLAEQPENAQYIYVPQCVSQVYFTLRREYKMNHWAAIEAAELEYLVPLLRWAHGTQFHRRHQGRNFWTVFSMDLGRQDFPRSAAWLEHWSVGSLTGSEQWMEGRTAHQRTLRGLPLAQASTKDQSCWEQDTVPVAVANEMFPARNYRKQDSIISIPSRFAPEGRTWRFGGRPVLAFFAGSPNSCARRRVLELYAEAPGFDVSSAFLDDAAYRARMWDSRFCLVMRGSSHTNNVRLYDVIAHGCIPVVISDDFQPPLDAWLPWEDIAIFMPTWEIPRLGYILRYEVDEARRWRYFQHLVLGAGSDDAERMVALTRSGALDRETLWSGLSAARIFHWHGTDFWILFFADVAAKMDAHIHAASAQGDNRSITVHPSQSSGKTVDFKWQRQDWWGAHKDLDDGRVRKESAKRSLLSSVQWLYHMMRRQQKAIPGVIIECGADTVVETASWLETLAARSQGKRTCNGNCTTIHNVGVAAATLEHLPKRYTELQRAGESREWSDLAWCGIRGGLVMDDDSALDNVEGSAQFTLEGAMKAALAAAATAHWGPLSISSSIFLLRLGPHCQGGATLLHTLGDQERTLTANVVPAVKLLLLTGVAGYRWDPMAALHGWLCFCLLGNGRLRPAFGPFPDKCADQEALCGHEDDPDLDTLVRLISGGGAVAGPPPARWGAGPAGGGRWPLNFVGARQGRFLYRAAAGM